jgi:hypothetical protein
MCMGIVLAIIGIFTDKFNGVLPIAALLVGIGIPNLDRPLFIEKKE